MRYLFLLCLVCVHPARADDPPILKRYLALEKKSGVKVRRVLGTGELVDGWTRAGAISADGKI